MHFPGPCPFLTCLIDGAHDHEECRACGTVRHGNLSCAECRAWVGIALPGEAP